MKVSYYIVLFFFLGLGMGVCDAIEKNEEESGFINYVLSRPELASGHYSVQKIVLEATSAASTEALYRLTDGTTQLILKEISSLSGESQIKALNEVKTYLTEHPLRLPEPEILLPFLMGSYSEGERVRHFIVLPEALGDSFDDLRQILISDGVTEKAIERVMNCFSKLGESMATMHMQGLMDNKECKTRFVHNDLHGGNVYCSEQHVIQLIDNEGFANFLKDPTSIASDLSTLLLQSTALPAIFIADRDMASEGQIREFIRLTQQFLEGYIRKVQGDGCFAIFADVVRQVCEEAYADLTSQGIAVVTSCEKEAIIQQLLMSLKN